MKRLRTLIDAKLWKFLLVGVVNTLAGMGIMFGLYNVAGCSYWVSSAANYVLTSILSFFLNKHFTFQSRERGAGQAVRFAANIAVCYLIAYGIAKPLCLRLLSGAAMERCPTSASSAKSATGCRTSASAFSPSAVRKPKKTETHSRMLSHPGILFGKNTNILLTSRQKSGYINT